MKTGTIIRKGREVKTSAIFSESGLYRYRLERDWSASDLFGEKKTVLFVMLNPSTASEHRDDPTIRRCQDYAERWGFSRLIVCNLFSYRATIRQVMIDHESPIGPDNDQHIVAAAEEADLIVCAWGNDGKHLDRQARVIEILDHFDLYCLKQNDDLSPVHPLYQRADLRPIRLLPF